jgi:hypothetical protein
LFNIFDNSGGEMGLQEYSIKFFIYGV